MMKSLLLASNNQGKIREFNELFKPFNISLITLKDLGINDEPEETGLTFIENALIKARNGSKLSGLPTLADDSGLVVDSLQGAPGIHSARYANTHNDKNNNLLLLENMLSIPRNQRNAHFKCVLTLLRYADDPVPIVSEGEVHGIIIEKEQGLEGFGYDPLFYLPHYQKTFAQIPLIEKNRISHRANASRQLIEKIEPLLHTIF